MNLIKNKKGDFAKGTIVPERIVKIMLILVGLLIIFVAARAYMLYQTGMSDDGLMQHFVLEDASFERLDSGWSPADEKSTKVFFQKVGNKLEISREKLDLNIRPCKIFDISNITKNILIDPAYGGDNKGLNRTLNGALITEGALLLDVAKKVALYLPEAKLTRDSDISVSLDEKKVMLEQEGSPFVVILKMSNSVGNENIVRVYTSSNTYENEKVGSQRLACTMMNSFVTNGYEKEHVSGTSMLEMIPEDEADMMLIDDKIAIMIEISNFNNDKAIGFTKSEDMAKIIQQGIDDFFKQEEELSAYYAQWAARKAELQAEAAAKAAQAAQAGTAGSSALAGYSGDPDFVIGDSIAVGFAQAIGFTPESGDAEIGRQPSAVLSKLKEKGEKLRGKLIDLSTGIANNVDGWTIVEEELKYLKSIGAKVRVLGVGNKWSYDHKDINAKLGTLVSKYGFYYYGGYDTATSDVHGSTSAYKQLAAKREADIASAGPAAGGSSSGSLPAASGKGQVVSVGKGYMWVPPDAKAGNYHLIIYLHGTESNANAVVNFDDVAAVADKFVNKNSHVPFIIVGPETSGQYFDDFSANSVLKDAQAKLNSVSDGIKIDPSKVSLTGHSGAGCQGGLVKTGTIYSQKFYAMGLIDSCSKASRVSIIEPRSNRLLFIFGNFAHTVGSNDVAGQKKALGATTSMSCPSSSYQKIVQCYTDGGNHYAFDLGSGAEHWHTIETGMEQFLKLFFS